MKFSQHIPTFLAILLMASCSNNDRIDSRTSGESPQDPPGSSAEENDAKGSRTERNSQDNNQIPSGGSTEQKKTSKDQDIDLPRNKKVTGSSLTGGHLIWKRYRIVEQNLMSALSLSKKQVCQELDKHSCIDKVHLNSLGGNNPLAGIYNRAPIPSALTAIAMDRVSLAACSKRVKLDKAAGPEAKVFKYFKLSGGQPSNTSIQSMTKDLYRRLLARDASDKEIEKVLAFARSIKDPEELAIATCYAIGTLTESVFF